MEDHHDDAPMEEEFEPQDDHEDSIDLGSYGIGQKEEPQGAAAPAADSKAGKIAGATSKAAGAAPSSTDDSDHHPSGKERKRQAPGAPGTVHPNKKVKNPSVKRSRHERDESANVGVDEQDGGGPDRGGPSDQSGPTEEKIADEHDSKKAKLEGAAVSMAGIIGADLMVPGINEKEMLSRFMERQDKEREAFFQYSFFRFPQGPPRHHQTFSTTRTRSWSPVCCVRILVSPSCRIAMCISVLYIYLSSYVIFTST